MELTSVIHETFQFYKYPNSSQANKPHLQETEIVLKHYYTYHMYYMCL